MAEKLEAFAMIVMGQSPLGENCNENGEGLPLLNGPTEFGTSHPTPVQWTTDIRKSAEPGDLLFCVRGSTTGRMNWADQRYAIGRGIAAIRPRAGARLRYLLRGVIELQLPGLLAAATGSTFPNVSARQLADLQAPDLLGTDETKVAELLESLDDKKELNRRMNVTLEAMAQAIFRDWFVDFGPVRRKLEGATDPVAIMGGLTPDSALAALFPAALGDDGLPEGWSEYRLAELAELERCQTNPQMNPGVTFEHYSLPAFDAGQSPVCEPGSGIKSNKATVPAGSVLLSKLNPEIPRVWLPDDPDELPQVASTEFLVFRPKLAGRTLLYALFRDTKFRQRLEGMVTGTSKSHQRVSPGALLKSNVLIGCEKAFAEFDSLAALMTQRCLSLRAESRTLAETRDYLLPYLMSGRVRVRDAAVIAEPGRDQEVRL